MQGVGVHSTGLGACAWCCWRGTGRDIASWGSVDSSKVEINTTHTDIIGDKISDRLSPTPLPFHFVASSRVSTERSVVLVSSHYHHSLPQASSVFLLRLKLVYVPFIFSYIKLPSVRSTIDPSLFDVSSIHRLLSGITNGSATLIFSETPSGLPPAPDRR